MSPCGASQGDAWETMIFVARVAQPAKVARLPNSPLTEQRNLGRLRYFFQGVRVDVSGARETTKFVARVAQPAEVARLPISALPDRRNLGRLRYFFQGVRVDVSGARETMKINPEGTKGAKKAGKESSRPSFLRG